MFHFAYPRNRPHPVASLSFGSTVIPTPPPGAKSGFPAGSWHATNEIINTQLFLFRCPEAMQS